MTWKVQIIETETDRVEKSIPCGDEHTAERVERGVLININHDKYHTAIIDGAQEAKQEKRP